VCATKRDNDGTCIFFCNNNKIEWNEWKIITMDDDDDNKEGNC
jgi:hypothetical protein